MSNAPWPKRASATISETAGSHVSIISNPQPTIDAALAATAFDQSMATDELAALRSESALANPAHLASFLKRGLPSRFQTLLPALRELQIPSLFIHGRDDRVVPFENSLRSVSILPNSRLLLINRCGHWAQIEHADEFNRVVAQFVANH
ncbi:MAG: 2-hydroxy-6-oxonona-2,4-dienedioate hydrolase [Mycobacterium sp.]|jgi:2-hydroxy-6-oxonona-2,4-dienedioate hydrolase|nr:2-hydroxy-6-oxonona-2,4-dienedioate hydrolase [Mycobacterium sp.]